MSYREVSEIRDGMRIDWDMPITMNDGIVTAVPHFPRQQVLQILKGAKPQKPPPVRRRRSSMQFQHRFGTRTKHSDVVALVVTVEGDGRAGAAGENVGDAAHAVNGGLRVARGDEKVHGANPRRHSSPRFPAERGSEDTT